MSWAARSRATISGVPLLRLLSLLQNNNLLREKGKRKQNHARLGGSLKHKAPASDLAA